MTNLYETIQSNFEEVAMGSRIIQEICGDWEDVANQSGLPTIFFKELALKDIIIQLHRRLDVSKRQQLEVNLN